MFSCRTNYRCIPDYLVRWAITTKNYYHQVSNSLVAFSYLNISVLDSQHYYSIWNTTASLICSEMRSSREKNNWRSVNFPEKIEKGNFPYTTTESVELLCNNSLLNILYWAVVWIQVYLWWGSYTFTYIMWAWCRICHFPPTYNGEGKS